MSIPTNEIKPGSKPDFTGPTWSAVKNGISKKPKPTVIESAGVYFEHFKDVEYCVLFMGRREEHARSAPMASDRIYGALRAWKLAFFRLVGIGSMKTANRAGKTVEVRALMIYNAVTGSGSRVSAFAERMREMAKSNDLPFLLHGLGGGPIKLMDVHAGQTTKIYQSLRDALADCFARIEGEGFQLESLHRVLSRPKGDYTIAHIEAEAIGEMLRLADFTPARFSPELELLTEKLRTKRIEFGFIGTFNSGGKTLVGLKEEATSMGMGWREIIVAEHGPDSPNQGQMIGQPFLLLTMKDQKADLRAYLTELAVRFRQDHVLFVYRDGSIELIEPYHDRLEATFTDLHAAVRAYLGTMYLLPVVEIILSNS